MWTEENARQHVLNRQDFSTWDMVMFEQDIPHIDYFLNAALPLAGTFPEPNYFHQIEGTWATTGSGSGERQINGKNIYYTTFFADRNDVNVPYIGGMEDEVFFLIPALADIGDDDSDSNDLFS